MIRRVSILVLCCATALAQSPPLAGPDSAFGAIEQIAARELASLGLPGVVFAFVANGRVVYARGIGAANAESQTPVTSDMLFRVGSMTKMVTALAVVSEAKARGISLDAPIGRYMKGLAPRVAGVTLAQLLSHTAGFKDVIVATPIDQDADETDLIREVRSWNDSVFFTEPGDVFSYSNLGFVLAGAFVADVASRPYSDVVADRVLKPLGITDATFKPEEAVTHPFADGHTGRRGDRPQVVKPIKTDARYWPAGFLWASALDYARIGIALMNHGIIDGHQALDPEVVAVVQQPHVRLWGRRDASYGFGLDVADIGSVRELSHNGRMDGYGSDIWMLPQLNRAVVVLRNRLDTSPRQTIAALRKMLLPSNTPPSSVGAAEANATPLDELTGRYVNGDRTVIISATASGSMMTDTEGDRRGTLRPVANDRLEFAYSSALTSGSGRAPVFVVRDSANYVKYVASGGRAFLRQAKK